MDLSQIEKLLNHENANLVRAVVIEKNGNSAKKHEFEFSKTPPDKLFELISSMKNFFSASFFTKSKTYDFKVSKKGKLLFNAYKSELPEKKDSYLISPYSPVLHEIGISADGKVKNAMFDKFKQINKFLELVVYAVKEGNVKTIIDFGCGKSYLGFALSEYFLSNNVSATITGVDLKADVIEKCKTIAQKLKLNNMKFIAGDILSTNECADMVISLHACDTATDYALYNAIKMNARVILSVPCCQHELNQNANLSSLIAFNQFPLLKERLLSLVTDGLRAELLTALNYKTSALEFIDFEFSPKNIMLKAIKANLSPLVKEAALNSVKELLNLAGCPQTLHSLLKQDNLI